ncbi:hypothetical protein Ciccas_002341 [Cichlidogyrus casuarinus]|uniref:Protein kinase domain-containing protein n=1 Tax=Cichlidogyrus casuarinus TaxID=1844966 RepID=A0ABD2QHH9_9PLAT
MQVPVVQLEQIRFLGGGSYGQVFLVYDKQSLRLLALKMNKKDPEKYLYALREAEISLRVKHPFIVEFFDCFQTVESFCVMMESLQLGDLFDYLHPSNKKPIKLDRKQAICVAAQVFLAYEYMHSMHMVHRDLKPENILIDDAGYIKLVDMGFARTVKENGRMYTFCGTIEYMAPETLKKTGYTYAIEWWALGILIFELLTHKTPFKPNSEKNEAIIRNILGDFEPDLTRIRYHDIRSLLHKLLRKDQTHRLGHIYGGPEKIKKHRAFNEINFENLKKRNMKSEYLLNVCDTIRPCNKDEKLEFISKELFDKHVYPHCYVMMRKIKEQEMSKRLSEIETLLK